MNENDRIEVTVRKESAMGCLVLFLEFAALTMGIALMIHNEGLHMVFSILIGLAISIVFFILARVPYFGRLIQAGLGLVWGLIIYFAIDNMFHYSSNVGLMKGLRANDPIWWWAIVIVVDLICVASHIYWFNKYLGTMNIHRKSRKSYSQAHYEDEDEHSNQIYVEKIDGVPVNTYIDLDDDSDDNANT